MVFTTSNTKQLLLYLKRLHTDYVVNTTHLTVTDQGWNNNGARPPQPILIEVINVKGNILYIIVLSDVTYLIPCTPPTHSLNYNHSIADKHTQEAI